MVPQVLMKEMQCRGTQDRHPFFFGRGSTKAETSGLDDQQKYDVQELLGKSPEALYSLIGPEFGCDKAFGQLRAATL